MSGVGGARGLEGTGEGGPLRRAGMAKDERVPVAQRRALAGPATLDTAAASARAAGASVLPSPVSPSQSSNVPSKPSGVRRRASIAEPESPRFPPSPRTPTLHPLSPTTDASLRLQQARASVALGQVGVGMQQSQRDNMTGGRGSAGTVAASVAGSKRAYSSNPPSATSSTYRTGGPLSAFPSSADPLLDIKPSDVRRPSFLATAATTATATAVPFTSIPRRFLFPSRRMQKSFRLWVVAVLALYLFIKLLGWLGPSPAAYRGLMQTVSQSAKLARVGAVEQLPPSFADLVGQIPHASSGLHGGGTTEHAAETPVQHVQGVMLRAEIGSEGDEGARVEAQLLSEAGELVLTQEELEEMRRNRRERLWGEPEEDVYVSIARPSKNKLHETTIVFLHGMGEKAPDSFMTVHLHKRFPNTRWVLPQAPDRPITHFRGEKHPAWFDIDGFPYVPSDRDDANLFSSVRSINRIIAEERALLIRNLRRRGGGAALSPGPRVGEGYPASLGPEGLDGYDEGFGTPEERAWASKRIVLAGFSQGAVVTLLAGLTHPYQLAGLVVFSGLLPLREDMSRLISDLDGRRDLPVFWGHGCEDPYLLFTDALTSASLLDPASLPDDAHPSSLYLDHPSYRLNLTRFTFKIYPGLEHTFAWPELQDVAAFLESVLPRGQQRGDRIPRDLERLEPARMAAGAVAPTAQLVVRETDGETTARTMKGGESVAGRRSGFEGELTHPAPG